MTARRILAVSSFLLLGLGACQLLSILAIPFQLLFKLLEGIGSGIGSAIGAVAVIEPLGEPGAPHGEGPVPTVTRTADGRFLIEAPSRPQPFRIRFEAPGREPVEFTWPQDAAKLGFADGSMPQRTAQGEIPEVRVFLEASPGR